MIQLTEAEHIEFRKAVLKLQALEASGVDNWEWYGDAMEEYEKLLKQAGLE